MGHKMGLDETCYSIEFDSISKRVGNDDFDGF